MSSIETINLSIGYPEKGRVDAIISDINLTLQGGELVSLLGLNGVGKSTLLRTICGFQPQLAGDIILCGRSILEYTQAQLALTLAVVLTHKGTNGGLTVYEVVAMGRHPHTGFWGKLSRNDKDIIERSMQEVGIAHKSHCFCSQLSDGERQKVMIAKALAQSAPIIVLDEPTAFLDIKSKQEVMNLLSRLAHEDRKSILLSSHDLDSAVKYSDKLWVLDRNLPVLCDTPQNMLSQNIFKAYFQI